MTIVEVQPNSCHLVRALGRKTLPGLPGDSRDSRDLVRDPWRLSNTCLKTAKRSGRSRNRVKIVGRKGTLYSTMAPPKGHAMALQGLVKLERGTRGHAAKQAPSPIDVAIFNANHCESGMAHRRYTEGKRS